MHFPLSDLDVGFNVAAVLMSGIWFHKCLASNLIFQLLIKCKINLLGSMFPHHHVTNPAWLSWNVHLRLMIWTGHLPGPAGRRESQEPVSWPSLDFQVDLFPGTRRCQTSWKDPVFTYADRGRLYFGIVMMKWGQFSRLRNSVPSNLVTAQILMV